MSDKDDGAGEFELIETWFAPLSTSYDGAFGLTDDAAVLDVADARNIVVTTDMLVSGVHFLDDTPAASIAAKALRSNLSDLAAMAAEPFAYTLSLALPQHPGDDWLDGFSQALGVEQQMFSIALIGGDTVSTSGPLSMCITAFGRVEPGRELRRSGAKPGDLVFVSGDIGASAMGLRVLRGEVEGLSEAEAEILVQRHYRPQPRIDLARGLGGLAHSAIDISDGLVQDLGHICRHSGLGARIEIKRIPITDTVMKASGGNMVDVLGGGEDYELLFTAPAANRIVVEEAANKANVDVTVIGEMHESEGIKLIDADGDEISADGISGFRHF